MVRVRDYFPANGTAYLVMDYEDGEPLSAVLAREKILPEKRVRRLLEEVLAALDAVHAKGYLHRDIKPNNLYVRARDGSTMLIDFGAARQALAPYTRTITNMVSPGYSPLEQYVLDDGHCYGPWTDLYALGAVLYQCITGAKPLEAPYRQMGRLLVPAVEAGAGRYRKDLLAAVDRALAMELDKRFESVAEMRAALIPKPPPGPTLVLKPGKGKPVQSGDRLPKRRWGVWAPVGILLLLLVAGGGIFVVRGIWSDGSTPSSAGTDRQEATEAQKRAEEAARQQAEAERRRQAEEEAKRQAEEQRRQAEEVARKQRQADDDKAFAAAKGVNTIAAYQDYLQKCPPLCARRAEAEDAIAKLKPKPGEVFQDSLADGSKGPEMVVIAAGEFQMGSPAKEEGRNSDERQHKVRIEKPFAIGRYEVTFEEYDRFASATGREKPDDLGWGRGRRPVMNVSWYDAVDYAKWLSQRTGQNYRLPTEAEWEYAARAGTQTAYWWGEEIGRGNANCGGCGSRWDNKQTAPVGSFAANLFGLYDTAGNVWEWTCSEYDADYKGGETRCISNDRASGPRVLRGGSWGLEPQRLRGAARSDRDPHDRFQLGGFRLARTFSL